MVAAAYVAINVVYNLGAKHIALLDVFLLSSGFVIRVLLGCVLLSAVPSPWLLLCTSTLALFLGFTKRRADLTEELDLDHRPSLRGYSKTFLDQAVSICTGVAILAYALYCIEVNREVLQAGQRNGLAAVRGLRNSELSSHGPRGGPRRGAGGRPSIIPSARRSACTVGWLIGGHVEPGIVVDEERNLGNEKKPRQIVKLTSPAGR